MIRTIFIILCSFILAFTNTIVLKNGQSSKCIIIDTSGCDVVIERNGKKSKIKKKLINFIVLEKDTLFYTDFSCPSSPKLKKVEQNQSKENIEEGYIVKYDIDADIKIGEISFTESITNKNEDYFKKKLERFFNSRKEIIEENYKTFWYKNRYCQKYIACKLFIKSNGIVDCKITNEILISPLIKENIREILKTFIKDHNIKNLSLVSIELKFSIAPIKEYKFDGKDVPHFPMDFKPKGPF